MLRGEGQRQGLEEDVERIIQLYNDHGYIQARVESTDVAVDREKARVTITFTIVEGPQFRVGTLKLAGVTLLPEPEVQRQLTLKSGDVFSRSKLRESIRNIENLYSTIGRASVDVVPKTDQVPGENTLNVAIEINEGPEVFVERINISGNVRSQDKILRREIPLHECDLYTLQKKERARQKLVNLGYFEKVEVNTQPGSDKTRIIVNVEVTERPTDNFRLVGGFWASDGVGRDSRDNAIAPTKGGQNSLTAEFAGLGGDSKYVKTGAFITQYYPIWLGHILAGRVEAGYGVGWADERLPVFERFYLGGPNSIRSFKFRQISPKDESGLRIGGSSEVLGNAEYIIPLPFGLRLAGFFDVGNVYGFGTKFDLTDLKKGVGGGVRWQSPFGPIRVDYGINPDRKAGEDFGAFNFSVGTPF